MFLPIITNKKDSANPKIDVSRAEFRLVLARIIFIPDKY